MTEQEKEIQTIKKRVFEIELSTADCERLAKKAGAAGLSVGDLLRNFIGDLVCGTYTNGSDERDRAEAWFERCWFGMFPERTFLKFLIDEWYIDDFLEMVADWEDAAADLAAYETMPTDPDEMEDYEAIKATHDSYLQDIQDIYTNYKETFERLPEWDKAEPDTLEKGIEAAKAWKAELDRLKGTTKEDLVQ